MAAVAAVSFAQEEKHDGMDNDLWKIFAGTYDFEVMGRPHRLYVCDSVDAPDNKKALYWSVADRTSNEYSVALGRDYDGVEYDGDNVYSARCDIFRLYGDRVLQGYYEMVFDKEALTFHLRERFPELEDGQADTEIWNEYDLVKLSPAIVGNPDLEGKQCFHPMGNSVYQIPLPSLWESDYSLLDDGFRSILIEENALSSCWKLDNEFGDTAQAGWHYGYDFEWDGALLLSRWDSVLKNHGCKVGSQFMVVLDDELAIVSTQCEDKITGRTTLMHLQDMHGHMMCPFETTPFDEEHEKEHESHDSGSGEPREP
eukprot:215218_1